MAIIELGRHPRSGHRADHRIGNGAGPSSSFTTGGKHVAAARRHWRSSMGSLRLGERSYKLIAVVVAGREVLMVRKCHTGLWDLPGGDLRVGEHPEVGMRRMVESDSSTVVAITGLVVSGPLAVERLGYP